MNIRKLTLAIALATSPLILTPAMAGERVAETRDAAPDGFVRVTLVRGELDIQGWDKNQIEVRGELDDKAEEFIFDVSRGDAIIEVKLPRDLGWNSGDASDLTIRVPRGSNVDISGVSTDIRVVDIDGGLDIGGVSGDLDIRSIRDRIDVTTVSGDLNVQDVSGRISLKAVSGDIDVRGGQGDFRLHTVSGDVLGRGLQGIDFELESVSGDLELIDTDYAEVRGHTVSGDVDIAGKLARGGTVELDTVSGSIRLEFVEPINARFELETASGSIRNRVTGDKPQTSRYVRDETLRFVAGSGEGEVIISSRSGDIVISRD